MRYALCAMRFTQNSGWPMIDIHNHVIYAFDDGPKTLDESLEMLKQAAGQGITDVFATSHFNEIIREESIADYFSKLEILQGELRKREIALRLHPGSEMFFHHYLHQTVKKLRTGALAGTNLYVLLELPLYLMPVGVEETLFNLRMEGFIPVIAHPERYSALHQKPEKILNFIRLGGLLQVNAGSALGGFGRTVQKIALWLLENQYAHFLASDAHSPRGRGFKLAETLKELEKNLDKTYLQKLVQDHPQKIINNEILEPLTLPEPEPRKGFLQRVKERLKL